MRVGILAVQGDVDAHAAALRAAGAEPFAVRRPAELAAAEALVLPGGESTTMLNFLAEGGFFDALREIAASRPVFATCAGAILLAREVLSPPQPSLALLDVTVERNAFGRQIASFVGPVEAPALGPEPFEGVFIRAPRFRRVGDDVEVVGRLARDGEAVLVRSGHLLAATFHPELTRDPRLHRYFLETVARPLEVP